MRKVFVAVCVSCLFLMSVAVAKDFWEKKAYTDWKEKEARSLLEKSPWTFEFRWGTIGDIGGGVKGSGAQAPAIAGSESGSKRGSISDGDIESEREMVTIIRIHLFSSRPVRQAYAALIAKGDAAKFDKMKDFANRDFGDEIVLSWTLDSKPKGVSTIFDLDKRLHSLSLAELKNDTFLATDTGKKVYIKDFVPPTNDGTGAKFIFPRVLDDGSPLLAEGVKSVKFQTIRFKLKEEEVAVDATFKVPDLLFDGKIEY